MNGQNLQIEGAQKYALQVNDVNTEAVLRITVDGEVYWREKLITGDDDFRAAMRDLATTMRTMADPNFAAEYVNLRNSIVGLTSRCEALEQTNANLQRLVAKQAAKLEGM